MNFNQDKIKEEPDGSRYRLVHNSFGDPTWELLGEPEKGDAERRRARRLDLPCIIPEVATERLAALVHQKEILGRALSVAYEANLELSKERQSLQRQRDHLANDLGDEHRRVKHLDRSLLALELDVKSSNQRLAKVQAPVNRIGGTISNIKDFLWQEKRNNRASKLVDSGEEIPIGNYTVDTIRQKVTKLKSEISEIHRAPYPSTEVKELARQKILQMATAAAPRFDQCIVDGVAPELSLLGIADNYSIRPEEFEWAKLCWLFPDEMIKRFEQEIDARADDDHALSESARTKKLNEFHKKLHEAEAIEAELLFSSGNELEIRPDHDPLALLNLQRLEN